MRSQLVVFFAVLGIASAAVAVAKLEEKPDEFKDKEGCYIGELNAVIPFSESRPSKAGCMEYRCGSEWVQYASCGVVHVSPPLELEERPDLPFPECCPKIKEPKKKDD